MHLDALPDDHAPETLARDARAFRRAALLAFAFVAVLWWIALVALALGVDFDALGVRPRHPWGLIGVLTGPLIHADLGHLTANTLPLLVLGTLALYFFPRATRRAWPVIWLVAGAGVWLFGRDSLHFGASGLNHGLLFLVFVLGLLRRDRPAVAAALIAFFLYGGMVITVLPTEPGVSFEYHAFGALGGLLGALAFRRLDPPPPRKKYSWELEEELAALRAQAEDDQYEPPRPEHVPVLWQRPAPPPPASNVVLFPGARARDLDDDPPSPTRH
jgi:membrane associated rhomboid family serine protease